MFQKLIISIISKFLNLLNFKYVKIMWYINSTTIYLNKKMINNYNRGLFPYHFVTKFNFGVFYLFKIVFMVLLFIIPFLLLIGRSLIKLCFIDSRLSTKISPISVLLCL